MRPAARILLAEADALPAVLEGRPSADFDRPTVCDLWTVRDVLAHCSAALTALVSGDTLDFSPEANQLGVDARRDLSVDEVLDELLGAYTAAATAIDEAAGAFDGLGLGEWVHGGDVRDALDVHNAYASAGIDLAVPLVIERSVERAGPAIAVDLSDTGESLRFGPGNPTGSLSTDRATFVRLVAGRKPDLERYELTGVEPGEMALFG